MPLYWGLALERWLNTSVIRRSPAKSAGYGFEKILISCFPRPPATKGLASALSAQI